LCTGACDLGEQRFAQPLKSSSEFYQQGQRSRRSLDLDVDVALAHSVFVDHKIVSANIGDEIALWILHPSFMVTIPVLGSK
jgi:hypothetical protein